MSHPAQLLFLGFWDSASKRTFTYVPYALPQTELYPVSLPPDGVLSQQDKTAPLARSEPNKTSSSFDLAINKDNKDFDYTNQRRGY